MSIVIIPMLVGHCPECGGDIRLEVEEWDTLNRIPTAAGCVFTCTGDGDCEHEYRLMDWARVEATCYAWVRKHVRMPDATPDDERARIEVLEWARRQLGARGAPGMGEGEA